MKVEKWMQDNHRYELGRIQHKNPIITEKELFRYMAQYARKFAAEQMDRVATECESLHMQWRAIKLLRARAAELEKDGGQG